MWWIIVVLDERVKCKWTYSRQIFFMNYQSRPLLIKLWYVIEILLVGIDTHLTILDSNILTVKIFTNFELFELCFGDFCLRNGFHDNNSLYLTWISWSHETKYKCTDSVNVFIIWWGSVMLTRNNKIGKTINVCAKMQSYNYMTWRKYSQRRKYSTFHEICTRFTPSMCVCCGSIPYLIFKVNSSFK